VIPTETLKNIDYDNSEIGCALSAEQIKDAPEEPSETQPVPLEEDLKLQESQIDRIH
jgi:hypothetical protein